MMDPVIRIVSVTSLFLTAYLLALSTKNWRWSGSLILLVICLAGFVINNETSNILSLSGNFALAADFVAKLTVGFLWLFLLATFDESFKFRPCRIVIVLIWGGVALSDFPNRDLGAAGQFLQHITIATGFVLVGHAIWRMLKSLEGDLRPARRQVRFWVGALLGFALLTDLSVDLFLGVNWRPPAFLMAQNASIGIAGILLAHILLRANLSDWFPNQTGTIEMHEITSQNRKAKKLIEVMESQKLYLQSDLQFSDYLKLSPFGEVQTRALINHELGFGHFKSFVNYFRVEQAKTMLRDPELVDEKIIGIALDSGFASLSSFQRVFKSYVGMTPTAWKKSGH